MAFRADEAKSSGYEWARGYLASPSLDPAARPLAEEALYEMIQQCGPVIGAYPIWHPLVPQKNLQEPNVLPGNNDGYYLGLDHTVFFAHGFVTCPYTDGANVFKSVERLPIHNCASITAERLDVVLYHPRTTAILVKCEWHEAFNERHMVPKRLAVPLMIEQEMRMWQQAKVGERWETMRPYFLGSPHGSRSSLFVTQDTALAMKRVYMAMVESGMFGPLQLD